MSTTDDGFTIHEDPDADERASRELSAAIRRSYQGGGQVTQAEQPQPSVGRSALNEALQEVERARQANDDLRLQVAEHRVEAMVARARADHRDAQTAAAPPPAERPDFGAGARAGRQEPESMSQILRDQYRGGRA